MRSKVYFSKDRKCAKMAVCNFLLWLSIITFLQEKNYILFVFPSFVVKNRLFNITYIVWVLVSKQEENIMRNRKQFSNTIKVIFKDHLYPEKVRYICIYMLDCCILHNTIITRVIDCSRSIQFFLKPTHHLEDEYNISN